jgi:hypothetical protein
MVTAQEAFGWALDHIWVEKTKQGTKELAVLIQVLSLSNLQPLNEQQLRLNK